MREDYKSFDISGEMVLVKKVDLSGHTLVLGFPGMGLVGTIAVKHLVDKTGMEEIGYMASEYFAPMVRVENGIPVHPARLFAHEKHKVTAFLCEQPIDKEVVFEIAQTIVDFAMEKGITRIIPLAGIIAQGEDVVIERGVTYGIAANEESLKEMKKYGVKPIESGMTTGVSALVLLLSKYSHLKAFSVLGVSEYQEDYRAAADVIKKLSEILNIQISVDTLLEEAKEIEESVRSSISQMQKLDTHYRKMGTTPLFG